MLVPHLSAAQAINFVAQACAEDGLGMTDSFPAIPALAQNDL